MMLKAHLILALLWILFGVLHSVLASLKLKDSFANAFPKQNKYYRLYYTFFAFLTFGLVLWYQLQLSSPLVFEQSVFSTGTGALLASTGLTIMVICIKKYFLSLSGLKSLFQKRPAQELMINGIHRYVRHPLYLGTFMAIWGLFLLYPVLSLLISNMAITAYTLVGIGFEERKLVAEFGADYQNYQQTVPRLIPSIRRKP
jgi:protein-S-isoprenylcysteine O-methyltransferase Ste14